MKVKIFLSFFCLGFSILSYSQEKINQLDKDGKNDGRWLVRLDDHWLIPKDTDKAVYCRYNFFDHGLNLNPMGAGGGKGWKCISTVNSTQYIGKMKLLDGEYKWYDKKGRLIFIHVLKNGEYVSYKEFYKSGELHEYFDYTKHQGQPHSYYIYLYDKKGKVKYEFNAYGGNGLDNKIKK